MWKRVAWARVALVGLLLPSLAPLLFGQRPAGGDGSSRMKMLALAELQALWQQKLLAKQTLQAQIARQRGIRDHYQALADQPYTWCPHKCSYPNCTHTELKARYDWLKQWNLAKVRQVEALLRVLQATLQQVEAELEVLKRRIATLTPTPLR